MWIALQITISEDGWVFAEFFKVHGVREVVHKLMKISPNGKEVINCSKDCIFKSFTRN